MLGGFRFIFILSIILALSASVSAYCSYEAEDVKDDEGNTNTPRGVSLKTNPDLIDASLSEPVIVGPNNKFDTTNLTPAIKGNEEASSLTTQPKKKDKQSYKAKKPNPPKISKFQGGVQISLAPWSQIQPIMDEFIEETIKDPNYEERIFRFEVTRDDWNSYRTWQKTLKEKGKYPIGFTFANKGAEGDRVEGVYAKYHKEICLINRSKKLDEAQNVFAYRLFGGKIDESQVDMRIFYELMVSSGIKAEDFEEGKYGFQEKILVKPVKLKESDLSTCSTEVLDMIEGTLKKTHQPYVTFVFELSEKASFRVQDIKPHRIREFHIPTIIDEEGRRLYMCFINDQRKTLDLHGMSYDEAFEKTKAYLQEKFDNYEDICTVITGRGNHENNNGSRGVISSAFPGWMKSKEFKPLVKHFVQRDGVYSVYLNNPEICDLKKLDTGQDPCEFVCETIRKVLLTNDLRLQILFDDPGFSMKLYEHLIFKAGNLAMQMSPYSQLTLPGELRLNLRNGNGPGSIHNFGGYEEKSRKTQKEKSNLKPSHKKSDPGKIKGAESPKKKTSEQRRNTPTKKPPVKQLNKAVPPKTTDPTIVTHPKPAPTTQAKAPMQTKNLDGKKQKSGAKSRPEYQKKK